RRAAQRRARRRRGRGPWDPARGSVSCGGGDLDAAADHGAQHAEEEREAHGQGEGRSAESLHPELLTKKLLRSCAEPRRTWDLDQAADRRQRPWIDPVEAVERRQAAWPRDPQRRG